MIRHIFTAITAIFIIIFLKACANIQAPQGGPKDAKPPKVVKSYPKPNSLDFKSNTMTFEFDEEIKENNFMEQLIISPTIKSEYTYKIRGKKLSITFNKPFEENTTYTLNFRNAIQDITENNAPKNFSIAFSTGPILDTLTISGKVTDLLTNKPLSNISVALYKSNDTLNISNSKPLYFAKSENDQYKITNIKKGAYDLYALEDLSNNLKYDSKEKIGFKTKITIDSNITNSDIYLTKIDTTAPEIISTSIINENEFTIKLKEGIKSQRIEYQKDTLFNVSYLIENQGNTIKIYNTWKIMEDSIPIRLALEDSSGNIGRGNIRIIYESKTKKKTETKTPLVITVNPDNGKLNPKGNKIKLNFSSPVTEIDFSQFQIKQDSLVKPFEKKNFTLNKQKLQAEVDIYYPENKDSLFLIIPDSTIKDFLNNYNRGLKEKFTVKKEEDYAILSGTITTEAKNYFFELLDDKYNPILTLKNPKKYELNFLNPGTYYIRILVDVNNNGKWDNADLEKMIQAEPVIHYKEKIGLRANWEVRDINIEF
ncbi:Ig-like domain-containing protein [Sporocytophaga myxococcoides]|uniref:Ig-like domain-containing protein n=1 Tax=Sporocytophaga myxococcoides TaxID=153721 RepID=UPI00041BE782|nr:Ig-like domain-containing protein [Sporocytophaga myxococcoides]